MSTTIILVGESGSGKSTLASLLEKHCRVCWSYTDRPMRFPNEPGHIFLTSEEFKRKQKDMIAVTEFAGYMYGLPADAVDNYDVLILEPYGAAEIRQNYSGSKRLFILGLTVSLHDKISRMAQRGDRTAEILTRVKSDKRFGWMERICDYILDSPSKDQFPLIADKIFSLINEVSGND